MATIAQEQKLHEIAKLRRGEQAVCDGLVDWLVMLVETAGALPAVERALVVRVLGQLGDPREGVGVKNGLPDIVWCDVPAGEFIYQSDERLTLPDFRISKYPITFGQFQVFLDAPDGFKKDEWWAGMPNEQEVLGRTRKVREISEASWPIVNPRVKV